MKDNELKLRTQNLLQKGQVKEAIELIFNAYQEEHPEAKNIRLFRDKVSYKLQNEMKSEGKKEDHSKLLVFAFMTVIGHSEGETAFNLIMLLLHLLHKGQATPISEAIELIKLEKASNNLNIAS
jgi:hypothetical protein